MSGWVNGCMDGCLANNKHSVKTCYVKDPICKCLNAQIFTGFTGIH